MSAPTKKIRDIGWKVRRYSPVEAFLVPVWYRNEGHWYLLNRDGSRDFLTDGEALEYRELAGVGVVL